MPTSRRRSASRSIASLTSYSMVAEAPPSAEELEAQFGDQSALGPGQARWAGVIGFENELTGDGRVIDEGALRWPENLANNPVPIRYVSSDVGAHDGAQVVGLIDTIERLTLAEANQRLASIGQPLIDAPPTSVPIWGEGIFDDAPEASVAQEAFRHVDKKYTNGVSMDLDDVSFEVETDEQESETMRTRDARIRAATIVAIPAFAGARIFVLSQSPVNSDGQQTLTADAQAATAATATTTGEDENPDIIVSTNSARGMRAQAITKARLAALSRRPRSTFAYQTTRVKSPEGEWVETPAAAIDIATNSTPPDDPFEKGLEILNEADMLELGSEEYLAKNREALPLFEQAAEAGGDRASDAKKIIEILNAYFDVNWPQPDAEGEQQGEEQAPEGDADEKKVIETAPADQAPAGGGAAPSPGATAAVTQGFAFNDKQWRNPHNGQWIDMPDKILGAFEKILSGHEWENSATGIPGGSDKNGKPVRPSLATSKVIGDSFFGKLNEGDAAGALEMLDSLDYALGKEKAQWDLQNTPEDYSDVDDAFEEALGKVESLKGVDWQSAINANSGIGEFDPSEAPIGESDIPELQDMKRLGLDPIYEEDLGQALENGDVDAIRAIRDEIGRDSEPTRNEMMKYLDGVLSELGFQVPGSGASAPAPLGESAVAGTIDNGRGDDDNSDLGFDPEAMGFSNDGESAVDAAYGYAESISEEYGMPLPREIEDLFNALQDNDIDAAHNARDELNQKVDELYDSSTDGNGDFDDGDSADEVNFYDTLLGAADNAIDGWQDDQRQSGTSVEQRDTAVGDAGYSPATVSQLGNWKQDGPSGAWELLTSSGDLLGTFEDGKFRPSDDGEGLLKTALLDTGKPGVAPNSGFKDLNSVLQSGASMDPNVSNVDELLNYFNDFVGEGTGQLGPSFSGFDQKWKELQRATENGDGTRAAEVARDMQHALDQTQWPDASDLDPDEKEFVAAIRKVMDNISDDMQEALQKIIDQQFGGKHASTSDERKRFSYVQKKVSDKERAAALAAAFKVPRMQVLDLLSALKPEQKPDELSELARGFVAQVKAGIALEDALRIYFKALQESGAGSMVFASGPRARAARPKAYNWVEETGGLPHFIKKIADHLREKGMTESAAIATAVNTVKRWARGGSAAKGQKGHVSAKTVAKAQAALAEWEAKKARANANSTIVQEAIDSGTAITASVSTRVHTPEVVERRQELLDQIRHIDVETGEVQAVTASWGRGREGNALSRRPVMSLNSSNGIPIAPPKAWFENPHLKEITPVTVDDDGRVYGHLASWQSCHVGSPAGEAICVMAPKTKTGYAYFHTGAVKTAEGETIATGRLVMDGNHADTRINATQAAAHYDNTTLAVADVRCGEDQYGIWIAGAMRPDVSAKKLRAFRASPLSGDWRKVAGNLELTIGLSVNAPGMPIPRPQGLVASIGGDSEAVDHELISLVAAGMIAPKKVIPPAGEGAFSVEELRYLRALAAREKDAEAQAQRDRVLATANKLAAAKNREKVAAFAAKQKAVSVTANEEGTADE